MAIFSSACRVFRLRGHATFILTVINATLRSRYTSLGVGNAFLSSCLEGETNLYLGAISLFIFVEIRDCTNVTVRHVVTTSSMIRAKEATDLDECFSGSRAGTLNWNGAKQTIIRSVNHQRENRTG